MLPITLHSTGDCIARNFYFITLYTFSTENWNRPADEISALMGLVLTSLEDEIFMKNNVRFRVIGDMKRLPQAVQDKLQETQCVASHQSVLASA